jgi:general secretion pathway protein I
VIHSRRHATRGFTLVEVLVALVVVALGMGALLTTISSSANAIARLRDKSFAQWIALNQISLLRLSGQRPAEGVTSGEVDYAGGKWRWQRQVTDQGVAGILRVEVRVAPQAVQTTKSTDSGSEVETFPATGVAFAFIGSAVMRASGIDPDWSLEAAASRTGGLGAGGPGAGGPETGAPGGGAGTPLGTQP